MNDMLMKIYNQLVENTTIKTLVENRIKFYVIPETLEVPFVCIRPLDVPVPNQYGSDKEISMQLTYQIDVETIKRMDAKVLQFEIKKEMLKLGFFQLNEGLDEYFEETKHFIDARRYRATTKLYDTKY